jgi:enoyl-CoA hydratase
MNAQSAVTSSGHVLLHTQGSLLTVVLNRPEALNALSLEMISDVARALDEAESGSAVGCVLIRGAGDRGLCAGGDIRRLYQSLERPDDWPARMWAQEYSLNAYMARYPKPLIAFMDGFVMGGGIGVAAHARHRIVTERTKAAMPEVGIGLIPDVGGTWLLSRKPGEIGTCLALTGMTIGPADAIGAGLADYFMQYAHIDELARDIAKIPPASSEAAVRALLLRYSEEPPAAVLAPHHVVIDSCMKGDRVEDIIARLEGSGDAFAAGLANAIRTKSPTSLKVTLRLLRLARGARCLEECLEREYRAVLRATEVGQDFKEGIRAAVIDKDRNPKWQPAELEAVTQADVDTYLSYQPEFAIPFRGGEV